MLRFKFFPFINILALLVLIAVGADDVFIFYDSWEQAKQEVGAGPRALEQAMSRAFSHAALSVFVTSLTTAAAFFANCVSHITAIQCFGVFAGLSILANFLFMITWTPTVIVLVDIVYTWCMRTCRPCNDCVRKCTEKMSKWSTYIFGRIFPYIVGKGWYIWNTY